MANKDLTSLKVYGNDDPAGSVYKVSGGGGAGGGLMLKMLYTDPSDAKTRYLARMDGSDATWQEIYDAVMAGMHISVIDIRPDEVSTDVYRVTSAIVADSIYSVKLTSVFPLSFTANTSTGRLTIDGTQ